MKIGVIIPDRNDRPKFLMNYFRMMKAQSVKHSILVVQHPSKEEDQFYKENPKGTREEFLKLAIPQECDITYRYRVGYEKMSSFDFDVLFFMENDDWYAPNYLDEMLKAWEAKGKPDMFGIDYSIYYHIKNNHYFWWPHPRRSSAFCMMIKPKLKITWPADNFNFLDMHLFNSSLMNGNHKFVRDFYSPPKPICIGIKHGIGDVGGIAHEERNTRYTANDVDKKFLRETVDEASFEFYDNFFK